jgi:hypothetical protein
MKFPSLALRMRQPTDRQMNVVHSQRLRALAASSLAALMFSGCGFFDGSDPASSIDTKAAAPGNPRAESGDSGGLQATSSDANGALKPSASPSESKGDSSATPSIGKGQVKDPVAEVPAPEVPPPPAPTTGTTSNSVDTMIADMTKLNDLVLKGVDPKYGFARGPGYVIMGNDPRGSNTPDWYKQSYPWMNNGTYWNFLLPWFVQFEGEGNAAHNTRIQMRNMKVFIKTRSGGTWYKVNKSDGVGGILCPQGSNYFHCPQSGVLRKEAEGVSSLPQPSYNLHGWWGSRESINGPDVAAVVVTLQARLAVDNPNGVDDRSRAKYLVQVGADYYPTNGSAETVLPAVGISRAKLLTNDWQSFTMATFNDVGKQEPGGGVSSREMRANPPPMD